MRDFKFGIYIPSIQKTVDFGQFTNRMHKNVLKYVQNNDMEGLHNYFLYIIGELNNEIDVTLLNKIDKFCILLTLRIVCLAPTLDLRMKCEITGKEYSNSIDLNNILQLATDLTYKSNQYIEIDDDISIKLTIPYNLYTLSDSMIDIIVDCISFIKVNEQEYDLTRLNTVERRTIIDILPGNTFMTAVEYANETQSKFEDFIILSDKSPHDKDSEERIHRLGLYDNSMFDFVRMTYSGSLSTHYELIYTLTSKVGMDSRYIESLTPAEANVYIKFKRDEVEKENQSRKQRSGKGHGPSLPDHMGSQVDNI